MNMSVQITIVGLGQIGASVGLALGKNRSDMRRVGHDKSPSVSRQAKKMGAVDDTKFNLPAAVRGADIVLLSLPVNEIHTALEVIAPDLAEGAVVLDTAPNQTSVAEWAQEILPEGRYYVGLVPAINPMYLHRIEMGIDAAEEDLFKDGLVVLGALPGVPGNVINVATDLIDALEATPLFADMVETDGLMSSIHIVPQLVSAGMLNAVTGQPGWEEARKLAGRPLAALASALAYQDEVESLTEAALLNRENVARVLGDVITSLQDLRNDIIDEERESLSERLETASDDHQLWLGQRLRGNWSDDDESKPDLVLPSFFERFLGTRKAPKKTEK
jgi:prephenate dehydrogenase